MATEEQRQRCVDEAVADLNDPHAAIGRLNLEVARLEAANAAAVKIVSILKANGMNLGVVQVPPVIQDTGRLYALKDAVAAFDAVLSDGGEGWLEVREQVARVKKAAQPLLSGGPVGCYHCTVEVGGDGQPQHGRNCPAQEFRAALDALGGK